MFSFDGKFWKMMGFLGTMFLVNAMWLIGCLPVVTAGASTAAMLHTYLRIFDQRAEPLHRLFWKGFASNFKQATLVWIVYLALFFDVGLVLWTGWQMDRLASWRENRLFLGIMLVIGLLALFSLQYIFGVIAYLDCSFQQCFTNALGLSFGHVGWTLLMLLLSALAVGIAYIAPFMTLLVFGAAGAADGRILLNILRRQIGAPEEEKDAS